MLAALAILALVGAASLPLLRPPSPGLQVEAAARGLCAALRSTRTRAVAANSPMALTVDVARKSYRSPLIGETSMPRDATIELTVADQQRESATNGGFLFYPSGQSSGGELTLLSGGRRARVSVNWLTGEARCEVM